MFCSKLSTFPVEILTSFCSYLAVADHKSAMCVSNLFQQAVINWRLERYAEIKDFIFSDPEGISGGVRPENRSLFNPEFKDSLNGIPFSKKYKKIQKYLIARKVHTYVPTFSMDLTDKAPGIIYESTALFRYLSFNVQHNINKISSREAFEFLLNFGAFVKEAAQEDSRGNSMFNDHLDMFYCTDEKSYNAILYFCKSLIDAGARIEGCKLAISKKLEELSYESFAEAPTIDLAEEAGEAAEDPTIDFAEESEEEDYSDDGLEPDRELFKSLLMELQDYIEVFETRNLGPWQ